MSMVKSSDPFVILRDVHDDDLYSVLFLEDGVTVEEVEAEITRVRNEKDDWNTDDIYYALHTKDLIKANAPIENIIEI